jgi:ferrous iron transport protein B
VASYFPASHVEEQRVQEQIQRTKLKVAELEPLAAAETRAPELDDQLKSLRDELHAQMEERNKVSEQLLANSYLGRFGKLIEPAVRPLGWDWRIGVGVLASFPAREVIVATLGTIYSLGGDVDENSAGLQSALQAATWPDGRPVYSIPVAMSIMVFFALCAQCASTLMVIRRETNHWGWAAFTFAYMTILAWIAAWIAFVVTSWIVR